jgi:aminoglycoside phosphotransferase (APT) family kinase protein
MTIEALPVEVSPARAGAPDERLPLWEFVRRSGLQSVVVGLSADPNAKVTILLVSPQTGRSRFAVKVPTTDGAAAAVEAEMRALADVRALIALPLSETLPRVVDVVDYEGRAAAVASAVPGTPMTISYMRRRHTANRARVAEDLAAVGAWLGDFQSATATTRGPLDMVGGVAERLRRRFPDDTELGGDLERLTEVGMRLARETVPRTAVHGDLWFGNVLLRDGRVSGVVDWEAGAVSGEPVRDLVRFALMYALYLDRRVAAGRKVPGHAGLRSGAWGAALEFALDGAGWFPELFQQFLRDGLTRLGASPEAWRDAALAGVAEVAAMTDHPDFGRHHLELFRRVTCGGSR